MHQDNKQTRVLSCGLRLLTTTLLPMLGLALLIAIMSHHVQPVRAGAANVWWVDGADGDDSASCLAPELPCETISGTLRKAANGDLIHVSTGIYTESLEITKSVSLVGGFDANWLRERGDRTTIRAASGRVVKIGENVTTTIVGFTLTGGTLVQEYSSGAGLGATNANVTMQDCAVIGNRNQGIRWGGGVFFSSVTAQLSDVDLYNNTISGTTGTSLGGGIAVINGSNVVIADSRIVSNSAGGGGGGIYVGNPFNDGSTLTLLRTQVLSNTSAGNGAGVLVDPGNTTASHLTMAGNLFQTNAAGGTGGAWYAFSDDEAARVFITADVNDVISNTASGGGGGFLSGEVVVNANGDNFRGNTAAVDGGGLFLDAVVVTSTFEGLHIVSNQAITNGGGLYVTGRATLFKADLTSNSAGGAGGGLYVASDDQRVALIASRVVSNSAGMGGGVALQEIDGGKFEAYRVHFAGNQSSGDGGAIGLRDPQAIITLSNSVLAWNAAGGAGGGLFFNGDKARIVNNTFVGDVTNSSHGIYLDLYDSGSSAEIVNVIVVGHEVGVQRTTTGTLEHGYNDVWDNTTNYDIPDPSGFRSVSVNPQFADRSGGDFHLTSSSPSGCSAGVRDCADSILAPDDDYDGQSRSYGSDEDKGADEYVPSGTCSDDGYEDNDSPASATLRGPGTYTNRRICPNDPDWYKVNVLRGATLQVSLNFNHDDGDLDVILLDENLLPLDAGMSSDDDEQVQVTAPVSGTYYLHVYGVDLGMGGARNDDYDLTIQISGLCSDDGYEQNDASAAGAAIGAGSYANLQMCPYDPDYYALTLPANKILTVTLSHVAADGDLDLWLYSPSGVYTDASLGLGDQEQVALDTVGTGSKEVVMRVCGYAGGQCGPTPVENGYDLEVIVLNNGPGVEMSPDRSSDADPGEAVVYQHTIRNVGNKTDTFALSAQSSRGWSVQVSTPPALAPWETAIVQVTVNVPAGAVADVVDTTVVTATSGLNASYTAAVTETTRVNYAPDITWDGAQVLNGVVPPATLVYSHLLTNDGNANDTFDLDMSTPPEITATLSASSLSIGRGASASLAITLETAAYPTIQSGSYDVSLTATSQREPSASQAVVDQVNVDVQTGVNLDGPFTLASTRPLSTVVYSHVVSNTGNVTDSFALSLAATVEITPDLGQSSLLLGPYAQASVPITLEIGPYPPVLSGTYPVTLSVVSNYDGGVNDQVSDVVPVDVPTGVALDAPRLFAYTRPLSTVVYSHVLTNTGDFDDRFSLTAQAPPGITATLSQHSFDLGAGIDASVAVTLELGPYPQVVSHTYGVTLTAVSDWDPSAGAQVVDQAHVHVLAGLELDAPVTLAHAQPLSTVVYSHAVTNTGEFAETVVPTATQYNGISVSFSPTQLLLDPYTSASFSVTLEIGAYPAVVSGTYDITVTAQSAGNAQANATVVDQVGVDVVTGVALDAPVLTSTFPSATVVYVHRLTNHGSVADSFSLSASAPAGITASLSSGQLLLGPGATSPFTVTLEIADYATIGAGVYDITVRAVSDYDAAVNATVVDQVEVEVVQYAIMLPLVLRNH